MLLPYFEWLESLWLGKAVVGSLWLFPVIEAVHLLGLSVLGGSILVVDLRLLGVGLKNYSVAVLARDARPYLIGALVTMIATGIPLFLSEAVKCYYNQSFWVKLCTASAVRSPQRTRVCSHSLALRAPLERPFAWVRSGSGAGNVRWAIVRPLPAGLTRERLVMDSCQGSGVTAQGVGAAIQLQP